MPRYRADHFRRHIPHETMAMGIGHHEYVAKDDAAAIAEAKALFRDHFVEKTDRVQIAELRERREPRVVWLISD